jgi:uncharacterized protein (TIGR02453 family)
LSKVIPQFEGFQPELFKYLKGLEKNNNSKWFNDHREEYEEYLVNPAKSFITSIAPFFNQLNPSIRTEPKFNQTIMRISNDMRFTKGDPYKNYFLVHFGKFKMDSEFYLYFDKGGISFGLFLNNTTGEELYFKQNLNEYRNEIISIFTQYKLNTKFNLHQISNAKDAPGLIKSKFNADKDFDKLSGLKLILFENALSNEDKKVYSPDLISHLVKIYSRLYPLYCFAVSPNPMSLIENFEDNLGVVI